MIKCKHSIGAKKKELPPVKYYYTLKFQLIILLNHRGILASSTVLGLFCFCSIQFKLSASLLTYIPEPARLFLSLRSKSPCYQQVHSRVLPHSYACRKEAKICLDDLVTIFYYRQLKCNSKIRQKLPNFKLQRILEQAVGAKKHCCASSNASAST